MVVAGLIAVLAILAVIAGTVSPAPSDVIVGYHGRFTCIPVGEKCEVHGRHPGGSGEQLLGRLDLRQNADSSESYEHS